jgi:hypothetical protein
LAAFDDVDRKIDDGVEVADEPFYFNCCSAGMEDDPELDLACTSFTNASSDCTAVSVSDVSDAEKDDHQSFDSKYNEVRTKIMKSPVSEKTKMVLYQINETTLSLW